MRVPLGVDIRPRRPPAPVGAGRFGRETPGPEGEIPSGQAP